MPSTRKPSHAAEELERRKKTSPTKSIIMGLAVVIAVIAVGYALYMRFGKVEEPTEIVAPPTEEIKSIAVLPFVNMSADPDQVYFCDGIADAILNALTHVGDLRVIARSSSFAFRGNAVDIREVGEKLNANWVLEGSVLKLGNKLRITAQLINIADESHLFSNTYDRELKDMFAILDDISLSIVDTLKVKLLDSEKAAIEKRPTDNLEAYDLYLLGRHYWYQIGWDNQIKALEYFLQAIEKDPEFALAYSGIADIYCRVGEWYVPKFPMITKAVAEKALELDNTIAEAHVSLARISLYYDYDWSRAESLCKRAIELNPGYDYAHNVYHAHLLITGRTEEALSEIKRAQELNPQNLEWIGYTINVYNYLGRYDEAMVESHKLKAMYPNAANYVLGIQYMYQGKYKEAIKLIEGLDKEVLDWYEFYLAYLYAISGDRDKAQKIFDTYIEQQKKAFEPTNIDELLARLNLRKLAPYIQSIDIEQLITEIKEQSEEMKESYVNKRMVWFYTAMGENDRAFECLDELYEMRGTRMIGVTWEPEMYPLHSDPRWAALMKKMGLLED